MSIQFRSPDFNHRPDFDVQVRRDSHSVRVELAGELDMSTAPRVLDTIDPMYAMDGVGPDAGKLIVMDLSQVTFCDARGLAVLVQVAEASRSYGHPVSLQGAPPAITRLLAITGEQDILEPW
jgi:anti-sigma B factor antagonist